MKENARTYLRTEIGLLEIVGTEEGIEEISFVESKGKESRKLPPTLRECKKQLNEYFNGKREQFTVKLKLEGSDFQSDVWNYVASIPFGKTVSYLEVAEWLGDRASVRAVGTANGQNKIPVIIPCHRVIGSDGSLTGYAGGVWRKDWLLKHEKKYARTEAQLEIF